MSYVMRSFGAVAFVVVGFAVSGCNGGGQTSYSASELDAASEIGSSLENPINCTLSGTCINVGSAPAIVPGSLSGVGVGSLSPATPLSGSEPGSEDAGYEEPVADDVGGLVFNRPYNPTQTVVDPYACDPSLRPLGGGNGSEARPFLICTAAHFEGFLGESSGSSELRYYQIVADIDFSGSGVVPNLHRLSDSVLDGRHPITGRQYVVRNLSVSRDVSALYSPPLRRSVATGALFGEVVRSELKNLVFSNVVFSVTAGEMTVYAGGIAGRSEHSRFRNIQVSGSFNLSSSSARSFARLGGLVGVALESEFLDIQSSALYLVARGIVSQNASTGGLIGEAEGSALSRIRIASAIDDQISSGFVGGVIGTLRSSLLEDVEVTSWGSSPRMINGPYANLGGVVGFMASSRIVSARVLANSRTLQGYSVGGIASVSSNSEMEWVRATDVALRGNYAGGLVSNLSGSTLVHSAFRGRIYFSPSRRYEAAPESYLQPGSLGGLAAFAFDSVVLRTIASGQIYQGTPSIASAAFNASAGVAEVEGSVRLQENDLNFTRIDARGYSGGLFGLTPTSVRNLELLNNRVQVGDFTCLSSTALDRHGTPLPSSIGGVGGRLNLAPSYTVRSENNLILVAVTAGSHCAWGAGTAIKGGIVRIIDSSGVSRLVPGITRNSFYDSNLLGGFPSGDGALGRNTSTLQSNGSHYSTWDFSRVWLLGVRSYPALRHTLGLSELHRVRGDLDIDVALPGLSSSLGDHLSPIEGNTIELNNSLINSRPLETFFGPNNLRL